MLHELLLEHPIDGQGRCQSCRRPGAVLGSRRRRCRVHIKARHWLHHPNTPFLLSQLASELGLIVTGTVATDPEATEVLPAIAGDPPTAPAQTPAVSPTPCFPAGQPDLDHGGAGAHPDSLRPRRGPSEDPSRPGGALLFAGGRT
ncbi:MAG: hypothetical protein ACRDTH_17770 [Pseudonocardiaceae bacterium]